MRIAGVAQKFGLSIDSLRYYERIGLIPPVTRNSSGIRDYSERDQGWVEFIVCMRAAGLPVDMLTRYVALMKEGDPTYQQRKALLREQRDALSHRVKDLQKALERLNAKIVEFDDKMASKEKKLK